MHKFDWEVDIKLWPVTSQLGVEPPTLEFIDDPQGFMNQTL